MQEASVKAKPLAQWRSVFTSICLASTSLLLPLQKFPELGLPDLEMPCAPHAVHVPSPQKGQPFCSQAVWGTSMREPHCIRLCAAPAGRIFAPPRLSGMALTCSSYPLSKRRGMTARDGPARLMERPGQRRSPLSAQGLSAPVF